MRLNLMLLGSFFATLIVAIFIYIDLVTDRQVATETEEIDESGFFVIDPTTNSSTQEPSPFTNTPIPVDDSAVPDIALVMGEVQVRLREYQTDEALNELNALLDEFDSLPDEEKGRVLIGYATYFTRLGQFEDAVFFYEAALELPGLRQDNRLAILQLLARFALGAEDWDKFLAYNDQYFTDGGDYNWIVTGQLLRAYQSIGDVDSQGRTLLLHLETGIDPTFDGSEAEYYERFGDFTSLPLTMSDSGAALELARALAEKFDGIENWKVLADVYASQSNESAFNQLMLEARERGFLDANDQWHIPNGARNRKLNRRGLTG